LCKHAHLLLHPCAPTLKRANAQSKKNSAIGLLKANVERAEWDVLLGVRDEHWPRIRQVSLQVCGRVCCGVCRGGEGVGEG
jgi:hypothetical protein